MTGEAPERASAGMHAVDGVLIAPAPADFADEAFTALKRSVLAAVHASSLRGVIIDVSRVELLDTSLFGILADTARMAGLLGARTVFVGFQPGVVSALIDMDAPCDHIVSATTLEEGLRMLRPPLPEAEPQTQDDSAQEGGPNEGGPRAAEDGEELGHDRAP